MKKKIRMLALLCLAVFALTACGSTEEKTYGGKTEAELQQILENTADDLLGLTPEQAAVSAAYYLQQTDDDQSELKADLLEQWIDVQPNLGEFISYSDFSADKTGKSLTCTLTMHCSNRDAHLVFVYTTYNMEISAVNVELVYTTGEKMSKAGLNTLMGIGTVFAILILISLIIYCFKLIPYLTDLLTKKEKAEEKKTEASTSVEMPASVADDTELIAVIAAAIAASTGQSKDDFVVRTIKRRY